MAAKAIEIRGARTNHLKDLSLDLPREAWTVVCGVSGSGKSSLVMDTLGAESVRRFLGTLSSEGAESLARPDVDRIDGLPPAVSAGFASRAPGPRETLATIAEAYDGLRVLFTRSAVPHCPRCSRSVRAVSPEQVLSDLLATPEGTKVVLLAPRGRGPEALAEARRDGFVRARVAGRMVRLDGPSPEGDVATDDAVEVVVDRLVVRPDARSRFADSVEQGFRTGNGVLRAVVERPAPARGKAPAPTDVSFADRPFCPECGLTYPPLSPALFSFHAIVGACPTCLGTGTVLELDPELVWPRHARVGRAVEALVRAAPAAGRAKRRRTLLHWARTEGLTARDRVGEASEESRGALLNATDPDGLIADLRAQGRTESFSRPKTCPACEGGRLGPFAAAARLEGHAMRALLDRTVTELAKTLEALVLPGAEGTLARPVRDDVVARLRFLEEVGLGYLEPSRAADTLSSGERRRAQLAAACAARMSGLLFLLDEPTMGLHPADRGPLRARLRRLVDDGSTVVCVEHDVEVLRAADHVVELGPLAGAEGGRLLDQGPVAEVLARGTCPMAVAAHRTPQPPRRAPRREGPSVRVVDATWRNLKGVTARFPHGALTCVTGVSGAGKSTLVFDVLAPAAQAQLAGAPLPPGRLKALEGLGEVDRVSVSDGAPPRHARSTPGSVLGVLGPLRDLYAATVEARARGYGPRRFSAHVKGGRCEACQGLGVRTVRLRRLPGSAAPCDVCGGSRFRPETLAIRVKGMSIADALALPLARAAEVFRDLRGIGGPTAAATQVGLGYVPLGEPTERLSGGEALRLRLAAALGRAGRTRTLYLLDEPCAGLHPTDVAHLTSVLLRLAEEGNVVVAVDHHPDLVRQADHVVDLGPGPGAEGGRLVIEGAPAAVAACRASRTGSSLG